MRNFKFFCQFSLLALLTVLIGCGKDKGVECGSIGDFTQQNFHVSMPSIAEFSFQNYAHISCFQGAYYADTYSRENYNINGFKYYTRQSKLEINKADGSILVLDFNKAFVGDHNEDKGFYWHGNEMMKGDFVYGINGNYVENPPYTSETALLWANYPTVVTITYYDAQGREWYSEDTEQYASATFEITNFQEADYSPEAAATTQYDFNFIANGKITCTLQARDDRQETKQLVDASFALPFQLLN